MLEMVKRRGETEEVGQAVGEAESVPPAREVEGEREALGVAVAVGVAWEEEEEEGEAVLQGLAVEPGGVGVAVDVGVGPAAPVGLAVPLARSVGALLVETVGEEVGDTAGVAVPVLDCDTPAEVVREVLGVGVALRRGEEVEEGDTVPITPPPLPGVRVPCAALAVPSRAKEGVE